MYKHKLIDFVVAFMEVLRVKVFQDILNHHMFFFVESEV